MDVNSSEQDGFHVVAVSGEVDLYSSPKMRQAIVDALSRKRARLIVDLSGVSYMDSSGIATLVEGLQLAKQHEGRLLLAGLTPRVREVFELARLESVFNLVESVEAALSSESGAAGGDEDEGT